MFPFPRFSDCPFKLVYVIHWKMLLHNKGVDRKDHSRFICSVKVLKIPLLAVKKYKQDKEPFLKHKRFFSKLGDQKSWSLFQWVCKLFSAILNSFCLLSNSFRLTLTVVTAINNIKFQIRLASTIWMQWKTRANCLIRRVVGHIAFNMVDSVALLLLS